jgi:hypothetical protein
MREHRLYLLVMDMDMRQRLIPVKMVTFAVVICLAVTAWADDGINGTIVSVDRKTGKMVLLESTTMRPVQVAISSAQMSSSLRVGSSIRVWGKAAKGNPSIFHATKFQIFSPGPRESDPTGVRSRLYRKRAY